MPHSRLPLRLILLGLIAIAVVVVIWLGIGMINGLLEFRERLLDLPALVRVPLTALVAAACAGLAWLAWKLLRPTRRSARAGGKPLVADRQTIETRVADLAARNADVASLEQELIELDRRRLSGECHVAVFGEISTGKSSLIRVASGAHEPTDGHIEIEGRKVAFASPLDALKTGVATIYQDLALAPRQPIWQNIYIGSELTRTLLPGHPRIKELNAQLADLDSETRELTDLVNELVELATDRRDNELVQPVRLADVADPAAARARCGDDAELVEVVRRLLDLRAEIAFGHAHRVGPFGLPPPGDGVLGRGASPAAWRGEWVAARRKAPLVRIEPPDDELIRVVLVKLFVDRQLAVDAHVIDYIAQRIDRSLDAARALVRSLDEAALAEGRRINRALAARLLERLAYDGSPGGESDES